MNSMNSVKNRTMNSMNSVRNTTMNSVNNVKNRTMNSVNNVKNRITDIFKNNVVLADYLLLFIIIITVIGLSLYINTQITKKKSNNTLMKKDLTYIENLVSNININDAQYQYDLRDYYIMSSYNSCCNGDFENSYVTTDALKQVIQRGARVLDFEVYSLNDKPVIAASSKDSFYQKGTYNSIPFGDAMDTINGHAFASSTAPNFNDPLLLHFRIKTSRTEVFDQMAKILSSTFSDKRLPNRYNYEYGGDNLTAEPLKIFMGKVVIMVDSSNKLYKTSKLDEIINVTTGSLFIKQLRDYDVKFTPSVDELINSNKKNMTISMPDLKVEPDNINPGLHFQMGCQMVCMNFQTMDTNMIYYLEEFNSKGSAFMIKPESLRYIKVYAETPTKQDPKLSYAPKQLKKPYFNHII